jgi:PadR family transcriptional regulator AphA
MRGLVEAVGEERGIAGGNRTILRTTRAGRAQLRKWLATPVGHLRDVRSELLLKLVLAEECDVDVAPMLSEQRARIARMAESLAESTASDDGAPDVVALWRRESSEAALRFLDKITS